MPIFKLTKVCSLVLISRGSSQYQQSKHKSENKKPPDV